MDDLDVFNVMARRVAVNEWNGDNGEQSFDP
jgi:hypothetical protein